MTQEDRPLTPTERRILATLGLNMIFFVLTVGFCIGALWTGETGLWLAAVVGLFPMAVCTFRIWQLKRQEARR